MNAPSDEAQVGILRHIEEVGQFEIGVAVDHAGLDVRGDDPYVDREVN